MDLEGLALWTPRVRHTGVQGKANATKKKLGCLIGGGWEEFAVARDTTIRTPATDIVDS